MDRRAFCADAQRAYELSKVRAAKWASARWVTNVSRDRIAIGAIVLIRLFDVTSAISRIGSRVRDAPLGPGKFRPRDSGRLAMS